MPLSRDVTAALAWQQAKRDLGDIDVNRIPEWERFDLMNRAIQTVAGQFYDLIAPSYMTSAIIVGNSGGVYDESGAATYVSTTQTITLSSGSRSVLSSDIGKMILMRSGTSLYVLTVKTVTSVSTFTVDGSPLPTGNLTLNTVYIVGKVAGSNTISLTGLRIMRAGQNIKLELYSTATSNIEAVTQKEIDTFQVGGSNSKKLVWAFTGDAINFSYGNALASEGTLTLRYPKLPDWLAIGQDTTNIDLPDGITIEIMITYLRGLIQLRLFGKKENNENQMTNLIQRMYETFGREVTLQVVKDKAKALAA
jgi:hypothetical protein